MGLPAWLTLAYSARDAGDEECAIAVLRNAAEDGRLEALLRLAMMLWPREESQANELIEQVEASVREGDSDTHLRPLSGVYLGANRETL
jgi:hypothetical protein